MSGSRDLEAGGVPARFAVFVRGELPGWAEFVRISGPSADRARTTPGPAARRRAPLAEIGVRVRPGAVLAQAARLAAGVAVRGFVVRGHRGRPAGRAGRGSGFIRARGVARPTRPAAPVAELETWLTEAKARGIGAVDTFAAGLEVHGAAVRAAPTRPGAAARPKDKSTGSSHSSSKVMAGPVLARSDAAFHQRYELRKMRKTHGNRGGSRAGAAARRSTCGTLWPTDGLSPGGRPGSRCRIFQSARRAVAGHRPGGSLLPRSRDFVTRSTRPGSEIMGLEAEPTTIGHAGGTVALPPDQKAASTRSSGLRAGARRVPVGTRRACSSFFGASGGRGPLRRSDTSVGEYCRAGDGTGAGRTRITGSAARRGCRRLSRAGSCRARSSSASPCPGCARRLPRSCPRRR